MVKTYGDLFLAARRALIASQGENAAPYARLLLSQLSGRTQAKLIADHDDPAPEALEEQLAAALARLDAGEPLAYLLGRWSFYGMELIVTPDVLIPRDDTMAVTDLAILHLRQLAPPQRVLDLCTGSGCIGLAIANHVPTARVSLCDVSPAALRVARQNTAQQKLAGRVHCLLGDARQKAPEFWGKFSLIVSNPPYVTREEMTQLDASVKDYEPLLALDGGADGLDFYRLILRNFTSALQPGGYLCLEFGMGQEHAVGELLRAHGYDTLRFVRDLRGVIRAVSARLPEIKTNV